MKNSIYPLSEWTFVTGYPYGKSYGLHVTATHGEGDETEEIEISDQDDPIEMQAITQANRDRFGDAVLAKMERILLAHKDV